MASNIRQKLTGLIELQPASQYAPETDDSKHTRQNYLVEYALEKPDSKHAVQSLEDDAVLSDEYPKGTKLALTATALILSIFLSALDSTIIATAIPKITDTFGSLGDLGWYGSAFSLTNAAFISTWGKAYKFFPLRSTLVLAIAILEIGNLITGAGPNNSTLIAGRAIAGLGSAGTVTGAFIIIAFTVRPELRAAYMGVLGVTFGCSSVIGPLMVGALAEHAGWRCCF